MQYKKIYQSIIKFLAPDLTIIISYNPKYLLKACKRHKLCYIGNEKDINAFTNQYRNIFTFNSNTGLLKKSRSKRKQLHNKLEDILLLKRQLCFNKRPI